MKYEHLNSDLENRLRRELDGNPLLMGDLMKFIGNYTAEYNAALKLQRDSEAKTATYDLLMCYKIPPKGIPAERLPCLIETIRALYPKGYDHSHSPASRIFLDEFVTAARKLGWKPNDTFIRDIRNFSEILELLYKQYDSAGKQ